MNTRSIFTGLTLVAAASLVLAAPAFAQDYRYDNRYNPDYRGQAQPDPGTYLPPPAPAVYQDNARVMRVAPRIEQVASPQEECRMEVEQVAPVQASGQGRSLGGALIGGLAGGILGNQVGGGNGRAVATAVGAVGGALVGDNLASGMNGSQTPPGPIERQVRRCNVVNRMVERNAGYDVSYTYNGRSYTTVMPSNPGTSLRVNVSVTPVY